MLAIGFVCLLLNTALCISGHSKLVIGLYFFLNTQHIAANDNCDVAEVFC